MHPNDYGLSKALYSANEACDTLGIGRNSLYALIHSGELIPVRFGRKVAFTAPDLVRVIVNRRGSNLPMQYGAASKLEVA